MSATAERAAMPNTAERFNAAFTAAMAGVVVLAERDFAHLGRLLGPAAAAIAWPSLNGVSWPRAAPDIGPAFDALKPANADWPRITLVTPSFNQAAYLGDCLASVAAQGYPNLQHIVMDGGSTDGSRAILDAHAAQLAVVRSEPDRGQTHALNKGFALADGDLIGWLNSDDMLAPGALHAIALGYLRSAADVVYGHVLAHRDQVFEAANEPRARADFSVEALGDIFGRWFQGHFFYQPEVFFTRRLLQQAGGRLDERLSYAMDYELWMRFAAAAARVAQVNWPVAMFRHHAAQKTADLDASIVEQAEIRDRFIRFCPSSQRLTALADRLAAYWRSPAPRIRLVVPARDGALQAAFSRLAPRIAAAEGVVIETHQMGAAAPQLGDSASDTLFVVIASQPAVSASIEALRAAHPGALIAVWAWNTGRETGQTYLAATQADLVIPARNPAGYLRNRNALHLPPVGSDPSQVSALIAVLRRAAVIARDAASADALT